MNIYVIRKTLSDGSHVFDVKLGNQQFQAYNEKEAYILAQKIADAINQYSLETVHQSFDTVLS